MVYKNKNFENIKILLLEGKTHVQIGEMLGMPHSTVSNYAKKFKIFRGKYKPPEKYDWKKIQEQLDRGVALSAVRKEHCLPKATMGKAKRTGKIVYTHVARINLPLSDYVLLVDGIFATQAIRRTLKKMLIREGRKYCCEGCGIIDWLADRIIFELDHIDGNSSNNKIENLRFLCPNCHSQTKTWRGRNIKRKRELRCGILV